MYCDCNFNFSLKLEGKETEVGISKVKTVKNIYKRTKSVLLRKSLYCYTIIAYLTLL